MSLNWQDAWHAIWLSPYLGMLLTLISFQIGLWLFRKSRQKPFLHPVMVSVVSLCAVVLLTDLTFERYMESAHILSQFLGPVIVALAIPLYENLKSLRQYWLPFLLSNVIGGAITILVAVGVLYLLGGSDMSVNSMWTKSITTAFALQIAPQIGGLASVAAAIIMFTGIFGALMAPSLFRMFNIHAAPAQGCALGICAHAVGTSKALEFGSEQGAFAALSMSFMGVLCAFTLPFLLS
ncbi:MAG: LrgB family protein [Gammaproteobacteria bacterium]|nr:LrgB family protein [Gammaproteobacteria bacterium]